MKKIDLHIHTIATFRDSDFDFSMESLKHYVDECNLDAIAITNHDIFMADQFREIKEELDIDVFPGIEIAMDNGHLLLISDGVDVSDFDAKCQLVTGKIQNIGDSISAQELESIFGGLDRYLLIPHYEKDPPIRGQTLTDLIPYIEAGEVDSAKKFIRTIKDDCKLAPVLFSDARICPGLAPFPTRQTFVDCGEITIAALKSCFRDKQKVSLSEHDGNSLFQVFENGQKISTGLNVLIGDRSSGKTYTLDSINDLENAKYIKQFSLVQRDAKKEEKEFKDDVQRRRELFVDNYLSGFRTLLDDVMAVDIDANEREVEKYITFLKKSADEADRRDAYSRAALYDETEFPIGDNTGLRDLIASVIHLAENNEYREIIEHYLNIDSLKLLACDLIERLWGKADDLRRKRHVNGMVKDVKEGLIVRSSATHVDNVDLYKVALEKKKVERFEDIVKSLKVESVVFDEVVQGFRVVARKGPFTRAKDIADVSKVKTSFQSALIRYDKPYRYLMELMKDAKLNSSDLYRLFVKITYQILNQHGTEVSGGEMSEFRLLQEIKDAQAYDILLIDEPESSFDNMFLKSDVNNLIREISRTMPVIVVTHNNTVGVSINADYLLYARKEMQGNAPPVYKLYCGYPTDKTLHSVCGQSVKNHEVIINSLEAGIDVYKERRRSYEAVED